MSHPVAGTRYSGPRTGVFVSVEVDPTTDTIRLLRFYYA